MSDNSKIAWCDATWNPIVGCSPMSDGCRHCYAASFAARGLSPKFRGLTKTVDGRAVFNGTVRCDEKLLDIPMHWKRPRRIFVNSMSDLYHSAVPDEFIDRVMATIALCPQHTFIVATKRPERAAQYSMGFQPLPNLIHLASVENQETADERIPHLLKIPGPVGLSVEPMLGPIDLTRLTGGVLSGISWVIVGGESGRNARLMEAEWVRSIRDQCVAAKVPFYFKQWYGANVRNRTLDGRTWDEFPTK